MKMKSKEQNLDVNKLDIAHYVKKKVLLISLYNHNLFSIRILHAIIEKYAHVETVFFKRNFYISGDKINLSSEKEYDLLMNLIRETKPEIIGLSLRTLFFPTAKEITQRIREISDAIIIWGGTHPIICPEECIQYADMICISEGETPVKNLFEKKSLDGFWVRHNGKVYKSNKRILTEDLNSIPIPDLYDKNKYHIESDKIQHGDPVNDMRVYDILASRGCPFDCSYCINSYLKKIYKLQRILRLRSVESVMKELNTLKKNSRNLRRLFFHDEMFALGNKEWIKEFVKRYKKEINLPFAIEYNPTTIVPMEESLKLLKSAGLDNMVIGIEGSERVRKEIYNRLISDQQMIKCQIILKKKGIFATYNLIVKNPLETVEDLKSIFNLVVKMPRPFSFHIFQLIHFPKTELTEKLVSQGLIKNDFRSDNPHSYIFTPKKNSEEDFWINLIGLSSKSFIPKRFLIFLSKRESLKKHQAPIYVLIRVSNLIKFMMDGLRWASKENFSYKILKRDIKDLKGFFVNYR